MSQLGLFLALYVLGVIAGLVLGLGTRPHLCGALGFLIGTVVMVALEMLCLSVGIPFTPGTGTAILAGACVLGLGVVVVRRDRPDRATWLVIAAWLAAAAVATYALTRHSYVLLSWDSHYLLQHARVIAEDGAFAPGTLEQLTPYGSFVVFQHALLVLTDRGYLFAFQPMLAASTIAAFVVMLGEALAVVGLRARWRWGAIAVVATATFTIYMVIRHAFYIQTNFGTASFTLVYCALFWIAEVTGDRRLLPAAFVALLAIALHRIEGPLACAVLVAVTVLPSERMARAALPGLTAVAALVFGWYALLASAAPAHSPYLDPTRAYLMASVLAVLAGFAWLAVQVPVLRRVARRAPAILAIALALALALAFALRFDHMASSAEGWARSLAFASWWSNAWIVIAALALLGLAVPAPPFRWVFVCGIPASLALTLLLVLARVPYYVGLGDSATRIALHVVPLAFFYFAIEFVPLLRRR